MSIIEKVPWICKEEWEYCRDNLFGDDMLMKKKAIQHLYIWKIRSSNLPAAVESTLILAEVYVRETEWKKDESEMDITTMSFESWYSMAIMRFLNLIMDSNVRAPTANTMNKLAKQFDIPEWIVEIRHIAAHGHSLPSVSSLRAAAEFCLTWLFDNYWCKDNYEDVIREKNNDQMFSIKCANACYVMHRYKLKGCTKLSDVGYSDKATIIGVFPKILGNRSLEEADDSSLEDVYKTGLLKFSRHLQKNNQRAESLTDYLLTEERDFICPNVENVTDARRRISEEWNDILSVICNSSGCAYLLQQLAIIVTSAFEKCWRRECAALYTIEILKSILCEKNFRNNSRKKLKRKLNSHIENTETPILNTTATLSDRELANFLEYLVQEPNEYVDAIIKNLTTMLESCSRSISFGRILELVNIYCGKSKMSVDAINDSVYRVSDVSKCVSAMQTRSSENVSPVTLYESNQSPWRKTPLGCLPWQHNFKPWLSIYLTDD